MRVTFATKFDKATYNINKHQEDISYLSNAMSSGKRLQSPHDDPAAWSQAMDIKQGIKELTAFGKNMDFVMGWSQSTNSALGQFEDLLTRAKQTAMKAVSQSTTTEQDADYQTVKQITDTALSLANSQHGNSYIFSGRSTSTPSFESGTFDYQGDTDPFEVRIGKNAHETVNLDGQTVFFTDPTDPNSNILKTLDDLATAIQAGDISTIQNQIGALDDAFDHIASMQATVGARMADLQQRQDILESVKIDNQDLLSNTEDSNIAEVITNLQQKQTALQATLQSTAFLKNLNLTNFL